MLADESAHRLSIQLQSLRCPVLCLALSCVVSGELTSNGIQPENHTDGTEVKGLQLGCVTSSFPT